MPAKWQLWFPFRIDAFRGSPSVQAMPPAARIGYLYLLSSCWQSEDCTISASPFDLAEESGLGDELWTLHGPRILRKFDPVSESRLTNISLQRDWNEAKRIFEARNSAAQRTNTERWASGKPSVTDSVTDRVPSRSAYTRTGTGTGTEVQKPSAKGKPSPDTSLQDFVDSWNQLSGKLPKVELFTDGRRKKVKTRVDHGLTLARWCEAVRECATKPFLSGDNERGWTATFDWLIANGENVEKAITNPYGKNGNGTGRHYAGKGESTYAALRECLAENSDGSGADGDSAGGETGQGNALTLLTAAGKRAP